MTNIVTCVFFYCYKLKKEDLDQNRGHSIWFQNDNMDNIKETHMSEIRNIYPIEVWDDLASIWSYFFSYDP